MHYLYKYIIFHMIMPQHLQGVKQDMEPMFLYITHETLINYFIVSDLDILGSNNFEFIAA